MHRALIVSRWPLWIPLTADTAAACVSVPWVDQATAVWCRGFSWWPTVSAVNSCTERSSLFWCPNWQLVLLFVLLWKCDLVGLEHLFVVLVVLVVVVFYVVWVLILRTVVLFLLFLLNLFHQLKIVLILFCLVFIRCVGFMVVYWLYFVNRVLMRCRKWSLLVQLEHQIVHKDLNHWIMSFNFGFRVPQLLLIFFYQTIMVVIMNLSRTLHRWTPFRFYEMSRFVWFLWLVQFVLLAALLAGFHHYHRLWCRWIRMILIVQASLLHWCREMYYEQSV